MVNPIKKLKVSLLILAGIMAFGIVGYMMIEGWGVTDALYMTVITLSTIGFMEVHRMDTAGRIFTVVLILVGVGTVAYVFKTAIGILLEGEIREVLGRKKVNEKIKRLKEHYIICGYGRMGKHICSEFAAAMFPFVVIEKDPEVVTEIHEKGHVVIQGDATQDETLLSAGIERATGLISVLTSDAENLYVVLSAREIKAKLKIITRAGGEGAEKKFKRAGADMVVSPYLIGASKIAQSIFRPHVASFLETAVSRDGKMGFRLDAIRISGSSSFNGVRIVDSRIREELGLLIVAVKKEDGTMNTSLAPSTILEAGDRLICVGKPEQLVELARLAGGEEETPESSS
ncbi:MAG: potassium channel protein [Deltaproteobacteria bacterium]|nr:potassium channel protein [Deltaproteobacteria bacterium]